MKKLAFLISLCSVSANSMAYDANHCNRLIEHGITNVTTKYGAQYAIAHKWHQYCRTAEYKDSVTKAQEAHASIVSLGGGGVTSDVSKMRETIDQWCQVNKDYASSRSDYHEEARTIDAAALSSWNNCQALAKDGIKITFDPKLPHSNYVDFTIDSESNGDYYFYDVKQDGFDCKISGVLEKNTKNELETLRVMKPIKNANWHVSCKRNNPSVVNIDGVMTLKYNIGYIAINTSGPLLSVAFPALPEVYYATPPRSVLAFAASDCPLGWEHYDKAVGMFIRGWDPKGSRSLQSPQADAMKSHTHNVNDPGHKHNVEHISKAGSHYDHGNDHSAWGYYGAPMLQTGNVKTGIEIDKFGEDETRPKNIALLYCIKR